MSFDLKERRKQNLPKKKEFLRVCVSPFPQIPSRFWTPAAKMYPEKEQRHPDKFTIEFMDLRLGWGRSFTFGNQLVHMGSQQCTAHAKDTHKLGLKFPFIPPRSTQFQHCLDEP